ncbi:MAG: hypothetical protein J6I72_03835 [Muribaculaceae bacterium]|nr:hypothetical protein [Muribaculaceae bacterium]
MKKTLLAICAMAMTLAASAQVNYVTVDPAAETVLPKVWGNFANMSFTFTFDEAVTVNNVENVKLYELGTTTSEVAPDDTWYTNTSNGGKTVQIWGSDYDGYMCTFSANDCDYEFVVPAGTFTSATGASNEEIRVRYYGLNAPAVPAQPLTYVSVDPEEDTVLGAETDYPGMSFTFTFDKAVTADATGVKLVKGSADGSEIAPSDAWNVTMGNANTTVQFWGADYDGFVDYFAVEDCDYYFIVPAGAIKAGDVENEEFVVRYYGKNLPTAIGDVKAAERHVVARYNINGQLVDANAQGIQLVKMSDGSTLKLIVK